MAKRTIYTRAYSKSSAGQLVSAKALRGDPLSPTDLLDEFRKHADRYNREPTALVSVSDRIVDTVKRAFDKRYGNGESPADTWVAFIEIPSIIHENPGRVHASRRLAEECELPEPNLFNHEMVFEWAIPEKYVLHKISLQTLMDRGLQWEHLTPKWPRASTFIDKRITMLYREGPPAYQALNLLYWCIQAHEHRTQAPTSLPN
ncbi:uncharacterized protein K444DRAFT_329003 [Hyaloscypha bicolor E]|uniref:DUF7587 domain-containing protein n=1 Tax=Hyaloscypha bicolor E TaxID=1095630 RepID=A0A2J6TJG4_9HELO|nr:uncharacterized protein K444DRAFT_329003 [Hyaloscypha bicolor E]PMD63140.1 hypothetical protein K444DRAFT_329003 [Hyaloscypha bicolor E]